MTIEDSVRILSQTVAGEWYAGPAAVPVTSAVKGIVLRAFEGKAPFGPETTSVIAQLGDVSSLTLHAEDSHLLAEPSDTIA